MGQYSLYGICKTGGKIFTLLMYHYQCISVLQYFGRPTAFERMRMFVVLHPIGEMLRRGKVETFSL